MVQSPYIETVIEVTHVGRAIENDKFAGSDGIDPLQWAWSICMAATLEDMCVRMGKVDTCSWQRW